MSSIFSYSAGSYSGARKRCAAPSAYQASAPSCLERLGDARVDAIVDQDFVAALLHEHRDRHAPGALAAHHPVGLGADHAADAVLPGGGHPARLADRLQRGRRAASAGRRRGLSIAMNHCGVLRKITGFFERQEWGYWCLSLPRAMSARPPISASITASLASPLLALVGDDALAFEARRLVGEGAVLVDRYRGCASRCRARRASRALAIQTRSPRGRGPARCGRSPCRCPR